MAALPMFPLGSVLFPHMPLLLRVFEPRYLVMLSRMLDATPAEFGVVLIERGQEVGGGERRFSVGTVARITEVGTTDGAFALVAHGGRRIRVLDWLPEDPHPVAETEELAALVWSEDARPLLEQAELVVRRALARASEFIESPWPSDVALSDDPVEAAWQLAGIAPLGEIDQLRLLEATSVRGLLASILDLTIASGEMLAPPWQDGGDPGEGDPEDPDASGPFGLGG
ncbi:MAG: LON peptidase substrate-binding domain-containing protein [Leifsonia sp.]